MQICKGDRLLWQIALTHNDLSIYIQSTSLSNTWKRSSLRTPSKSASVFAISRYLGSRSVSFATAEGNACLRVRLPLRETAKQPLTQSDPAIRNNGLDCESRLLVAAVVFLFVVANTKVLLKASYFGCARRFFRLLIASLQHSQSLYSSFSCTQSCFIAIAFSDK